MARKKKEKVVKEKPVAEEARDVKKKGQKYLSGTRFVLFVGDEGSILLYMKENQVLSRQFVPDASEQNLEELRGTLNKDPKAPFSMAIDSLDQSYVQQTLPPVSSMSVKKLINRRLERDFGANDIKGAILLGRDQGGRKDWNFLMVSIERSRQISLWLDFAFSLPNRFSGIYLVSVETEIVIKNLERAMGVDAKTGTGSKWKFFISHNKVGGFRQVILQNGRIIFTRMAQPIGEATPEVLAGNIEQEMQSTMEYMKRLGYDPAQGLDIYIVAASSIKPVIDKTKFKYSNFHTLTPYEAAKLLGIQGATQPTDQFGDVVLAATISASPAHVLKLTTPESRKFESLYSMFKLQRVAAALAIMGTVGYAGGVASDIYLRFLESDDLITAKRQKQNNLDQLKEEIKQSNLDVDKTGDIIELYQLLQKQKSLPLSFLAVLQTVIKDPITIKSIEWVSDDKGPGGVPLPAPKMNATIVLQFPTVPNVEAWRLVSKEVMTQLKDVFKGYDVNFTKIPQRFAETDKMDITFDSNAAPKQPSAPTGSSDVVLVIKEL
ncbi:MAG: hypothetical protein EBV03_07130 [Proteobacteria bacterium]|nr:hypothetical protein [Pseudomonadota bacterium]